MSLRIHISNRVEALAGTLADGIKNSGSFFRAADPLRKTRIVVQSRGVEIWLKQFFAGHGIPVVNFDFPFMQNAVKDILKINSVSRVSKMLGYQSVYSFSRAYKSYFGYAPSKTKA